MPNPHNLTLVIGNKAYSSWSLRPWIALAVKNIPFEEVLIPLRQEDTKQKMLTHSPVGKVPVLKAGATTIWESLAILEYLAEQFPEAKLWPEDAQQRALARSLSSEIHAGFGGIRTNYPMNLRRSHARPLPSALTGELARLEQIMSQTRLEIGAKGGFIFGEFGAVDAMLAPLATRIASYHLPVSAQMKDYVAAIYALPAFKLWQEAALRETWHIADTDDIDSILPIN